MWCPVAFRNIMTHFGFICDEGEVGDGDPADTPPEKSPAEPGGWVRGHQADGGGYATEMPKCITGKGIKKKTL